MWSWVTWVCILMLLVIGVVAIILMVSNTGFDETHRQPRDKVIDTTNHTIDQTTTNQPSDQTTKETRETIDQTTPKQTETGKAVEAIKSSFSKRLAVDPSFFSVHHVPGNTTIFRFPSNNTSRAKFVTITRAINWKEGRISGRTDQVLDNRNIVALLDIDGTILEQSELQDTSNRFRHPQAMWIGLEDCRLYDADATQLKFMATTFEFEAGNAPQVADCRAIRTEDRWTWNLVSVVPLKRLNPKGEKNWLPFPVSCSSSCDRTEAIYHWHPFQLIAWPKTTNTTSEPDTALDP